MFYYYLTMDYIIGFLFGYFGRFFFNALKDLSTGEFYQSNYEEIDLYPLTEDDLP